MSREEKKNEETIRKLVQLPENKKCADCNDVGRTYVCSNFNTFICTACAGIHREFSHRVKSISMATFTTAEVDSLKAGGNEVANKIWLARWSPSDYPVPDHNDANKLRDFLKLKYKDKRWWDQPGATQTRARGPSVTSPVKATPQKSSDAQVRPITDIMGNEPLPKLVVGEQTQQNLWQDDGFSKVAPAAAPAPAPAQQPFDFFSAPAAAPQPQQPAASSGWDAFSSTPRNAAPAATEKKAGWDELSSLFTKPAAQPQPMAQPMAQPQQQMWAAQPYGMPQAAPMPGYPAQPMMGMTPQYGAYPPYYMAMPAYGAPAPAATRPAYAAAPYPGNMMYTTPFDAPAPAQPAANAPTPKPTQPDMFANLGGSTAASGPSMQPKPAAPFDPFGSTASAPAQPRQQPAVFNPFE